MAISPDHAIASLRDVLVYQRIDQAHANYSAILRRVVTTRDKSAPA